MATKIILEPKDWKILVEYLSAQPVDFTQLETAVKVKRIIEAVQLIELEITPTSNGINSNGSN